MSDISFHTPRVRIDLDLLDKIETEHGGVDMSGQLKRYDVNSEWGYSGYMSEETDGEYVLYSDVITMQERIATLEKVAEAANKLLEGRHTLTGILRTPLSEALDKALREAGYGGGE